MSISSSDSAKQMTIRTKIGACPQPSRVYGRLNRAEGLAHQDSWHHPRLIAFIAATNTYHPINKNFIFCGLLLDSAIQRSIGPLLIRRLECSWKHCEVMAHHQGLRHGSSSKFSVFTCRSPHFDHKVYSSDR